MTLYTMTLATYLRLAQFRRYVPDWVVAALVLAYFVLIGEKAKPFNRQFKLSDPTLQHPFATHERVPNALCLALAAGVPFLVMTLCTFVKHRSRPQVWHVLQVLLLGAVLAIAVDGAITDVLKNWVGRPRPDFLQRCGAKAGTPLDVYVDVSVCTAPLGEGILTDGMRLTPLGHSSISFAAYLYLLMWLFGQYKMLNVSTLLLQYMAASAPLFLATYVALSRTQDYRHHFVDIFSGGFLGCAIAVAVYSRYFRPVTHANLDEINGEEEHELPL